MPIPHIIHYCWFGGNEKPDNIRAFIQGWKEKLKDYTFVEWNESNFSIDDAPEYVKEAYSVKKYAFVSDYARIKALCEQGGIYFDTDIDLVRRFDDLLEGHEMVLGFESDMQLETAFIASTPDNKYITTFLKTYDNRHFINPDGSYDMSVINKHFSDCMESFGVNLDNEDIQSIDDGAVVVYPREYFAAFDIGNWHIKPTENTYTVHHMNSSWSTSKKKLYFGVIHFLQKILGFDGYDKLKAKYDKIKKRR